MNYLKTWFKDLSIKHKLITIILSVAILSQIIAFTIITIDRMHNLRDELQHEADLQARLIGEYSISPIIFDDIQGIRKILKKIDAIANLQSAVVYDKEGKLLTYYQKIEREQPPARENFTDANYLTDMIHVQETIQYNKNKIGSIHLFASTEKLSSGLRRQVLTILLVIMGMVIIVYLMASRFQVVISRPIKKLSEIAKDISREPDFSLRLERQGRDEIGDLYTSFNKMLKKIETHSKQRDKALNNIKSQYERFLAILDSFPEYIYIVDPKTHKVLFVNKVLEQELGVDPVGKLCFNAFHGSPSECTFCKLDDLKQKDDPITWEHYNEELDKHFLITDQLIQWPDGREVLFEVSIDISERTNLEEQLRQAQKMESVGRLAGGVAHDLNNLLTPIMGYGELLQEELQGDQMKQTKAEEIVKAAIRSRDLIRKLLAFSRKQTLEFTTLNINQVLQNFEKLIRRTIHEDIAMNFELEEQLPPVKADIGQIEQVIMNLAVNAQDAMPGGGNLSFKTDYVELDESYGATHQEFTPGKYVMLSISDTGHGMDETTQQKIFEPFFSTKGQEGTGLGLSTVYGIVKQHGGDIHVYSEPGQGTTFNIYLPVSADYIEEKQETEKQTEKRTGGAERILVAEDNLQALELVNTVLSGEGYDVIPAENGEAALQKIKQLDKPVDIILTDVVMPGMNGRELYTKISEIYPDIKVVFTSGYSDDVVSHHGVLNENVHFIHKPFSIDDLKNKIYEVLNEEE